MLKLRRDKANNLLSQINQQITIQDLNELKPKLMHQLWLMICLIN